MTPWRNAHGLVRAVARPLPRVGAFASFMPAAFVAWLFVFGYTGAMAGAAVGRPVLGGVVGLAVGARPAIGMGVIAHYGAPTGLLGIPFMIALALVGGLWLGLAFSALPLARWLVLRVRSRTAPPTHL